MLYLYWYVLCGKLEVMSTLLTQCIVIPMEEIFMRFAVFFVLNKVENY